MATWADAARVLSLTGVTVTDAQLIQAQGVIETHVDIDPANPGDHLSARDRERLVKAHAYQAGWMFDKIDLFSRTDISQISQDGVSVTYANPDAVELGPLAKRNIDQLSWNQDGAWSPKPIRTYADLAELRDAVLRDEVDVVPWVYEAGGL
jgi:hypothetical protein